MSGSTGASALADGCRDLARNGHFTDFTILCGGDEHQVHRLVICSHSEYFRKCCTSSFAEASSRKIELKEDDPAIVKLMIDDFYDLHYEVPSTTPLDREPAHCHALVYALADKYAIPALKNLALSSFSQALDTHSNSFTRRPTNGGLLLSTTQLLWSLPPLPPTSSDKNPDLHSHALLAWRNAGRVMLGPGTDALLQKLPGFATNLAKSFLDSPKANKGGGEIAFDDEGGENIGYNKAFMCGGGGGGF